ncbi:MAG: ribosome biogenesis GTPase Der [Treponema sp.]|jgi:GTP-binding protein|nr:ribosome biogenesis GTPase Der [Treponema sp.]
MGTELTVELPNVKLPAAAKRKYQNLPTVVLAGRPNVGKSTLFNRLLRKRRAITDPTPGVTRDPVEADCIINEKPVRLIDTGGFKLAESESIDKLVVEKTIAAIKKADLVILILEAGEITSEDEEFIALLRPYRDKLIAAVNKTEGGRRQSDAWNVLSFGFDKVFMISAEHGDNVGELEQEIINRLDFSNVEETQEQTPVRITLLGKPNTGKSTLSNRLTSTSASIVSKIPGTTRDTVEGSFSWKSQNFVILDTAGIRRKAKVTENIEYYSVNRAIKTINESDIVVLMIDAEEGLTDQDKKIAALAHDKGRGIVMALNKWDVLTAEDDEKSNSLRAPAGNKSAMPQEKKILKTITDRIHFQFGQMEYAPIIPISAKNGTGVDKLLNTIIKMHRQLNLRIGTARLNQALEKWLLESPPPSGPKTRFKIKYAVQKSANPVHIILFASRLRAVNETYISYLRNKIRKELGFSLIPILVEVKDSSGKRAD